MNRLISMGFIYRLESGYKLWGFSHLHYVLSPNLFQIFATAVKLLRPRVGLPFQSWRQQTRPLCLIPLDLRLR